MAESNVNAPFQRQNWQCACALSRDRVVGGHPKPHIWNQRAQFAYSLYNFYGATTTIKGRLHGSTPIVKRFSGENSESGAKMAVFRELRGVNVKFLSSNPEKAHPLRGTASFDVLRVKIGSGV